MGITKGEKEKGIENLFHKSSEIHRHPDTRSSQNPQLN
jgi:hypothetical protein